MFPFGPFQPEDPPERAPTDPDQVDPETVGDAIDVDLVMHDKTLRHRAVQFAQMGFNARQSRALALDKEADVHWIRDNLMSRGCDPLVAFHIVS